MRKAFFRIIYLVVVFLVSCFLISKVMNQGNTDITAPMAEPTYPVMQMLVAGETANELHGYSHVMDCSYMRDTLTTVTSDRTAYYTIECYDNDIQSMLFEIRSMDGKRLVESTPMTTYNQAGSKIYGHIVVKDLIDPGKEYMLVFVLGLTDGTEVRYYTRLLQTDDYHVEEKLAYIRDFHNKTFRKDKASELSKYLEPNSEGDNSTFSKVTIHSSLNQVTWGNLKVEKVYEPTINIKELAAQTGTFELDYPISMRYRGETHYYLVNEKYRIRYTPDRIYLLDYERTMNQIFDENADAYTNDKIDLGITDENIQIEESDGGNVFAFTSQGKVYSYNVSDNKMALLFSFYTDDMRDKRAVYPKHDAKILAVDETGNVEFMVYGYMNRGRHEGQVGLAVYTYNSMLNTVEENSYIDYGKSYQLLKNEIEQLSYVSRDGIGSFMLDGTVYALNLREHTYNVMADNLLEGSYQVSDSHQMLVWQADGDLYSCSKLELYNLMTGSQSEIPAGYGNYIIPLGFMEEDLIYGLAKKNDVVKDEKGNTQFPLYTIRIQDDRGNLLKNYHEDDVFTTSWEITDKQVSLIREKRDPETGSWSAAPNDQILKTKEEKVGNNIVRTALTDDYEKIVQIQTKTEIKAKNMKMLTPKEVIFEGNREYAIGSGDERTKHYYVYDIHGVQGIYRSAGNAVKQAYQNAGVVVGDKGQYIWIRGNRVGRNQIMAIKAPESEEDVNTVAVCLDTILHYEGVSTNTEILLNNGSTILDILENNLQDKMILDLTGCSLDAVLYYINRDIPVLAILQDGKAVTITGFNETQIVILNPEREELYKMSITEASEWFDENGNTFITYVPVED